MTSSAPPGLSEPPLAWPFYGASFGIAVRRFWKKYATFSGRASRSEFWWAYLGTAIVFFGAEVLFGIIVVAIAIIAHQPGQTQTASQVGLVLSSIVTLALFGIVIPQLAITVRRLHDTNRSGWYILLGLIPWAGGIIMLVFTVGDTKPEGVRFDAVSSAQPSSP
jgi:uncharacterized membrane protein YhaH (DUF805 family)